MFILSIISLFVGTSLFLIRNSIFTIISKIKKYFTLFVETILFKIPGFESFYNQGYFLFYWTVCWLVCRFTIIAPINILLVSENDFILTLVMIRLISIVIALIIALIPTVLLTRNQHINDIITGLHYSYCTQEPWFLNMILRIHVIKCAIYHSKIRLFIAFLTVFTVFMFYLFTGDKLFLIIFLLIMYSRLYSQNFISKVIPGLDSLSEFSYTIPHRYFLASYKYRYWEDTTPNNPIEDVEDPDYFFTAIHRDEYLNLKQLYLDTLFVDMVNDPSLNPHEKLRYYNEVMRHRDPEKTSIFLDTIKKEISDLNKLKSSTKNYNSQQKRSFHTTCRVAVLDEFNNLSKGIPENYQRNQGRRCLDLGSGFNPNGFDLNAFRNEHYGLGDPSGFKKNSSGLYLPSNPAVTPNSSPPLPESARLMQKYGSKSVIRFVSAVTMTYVSVGVADGVYKLGTDPDGIVQAGAKALNSSTGERFSRHMANSFDEDDTLIDLLGTRSPASTPPATPRAGTTAELSVSNKTETVEQSSVAGKSEFSNSKRLVTGTKLWKKLTGSGGKEK
jgi:hypothetical protein